MKDVTRASSLVVGISLLSLPLMLALIAFPALLIQATSIAGILAAGATSGNIYTMDNSSYQVGDPIDIDSNPGIQEAVQIALQDPLVSSILSGVKWEVTAAIPILDYNGVSLAFSLAEPVFVKHEFRQWYNPLGSVKIQGWTTQLIVDVDLSEGKVKAVMPSEPRYDKTPPAKVTAAKLGSIGDRVLRGAVMLEEYKAFSDVKGAEARPFWVVSYGPVEKAYYHVVDWKGEPVGIGCVDLKLMVIDGTCTGKIVKVPDAIRGISEEASLAAKLSDSNPTNTMQANVMFNAKPIYRYGDAFYNYDFNTRSLNDVDWPINLVFFQNADVNKVKLIYPGIPGSTKYAYLNDGPGWYWDSDRGVKPIINAGTQCNIDLGTAFLHLRIYADYNNKLTNYRWGNYVIVTAHLDDFPEIPGITPAGFNEAAENFASSIASSKGYQVYYDYDYFDNYTGRCVKVGHKYYWNYGYADFIKVP